MTERRTARRYDLSLPVLIRLPIEEQKTSRSGNTRDISTRGLYFTINEDLSVGALLDITLTLPAEITRGTEVFVRAQGKVVRVDRGTDEPGQPIGVAAVIERYDIIRGESTNA